MTTAGQQKPVHFVGSTVKDLRGLPIPVRGAFGRQLLDAQYGDHPVSAQPLKGFGAADVLELREGDSEGAYRVVYTIRYPGVVYVLHVFTKKAVHGIATPKRHVDLIRRRLQDAQWHYWRFHGSKKRRDQGGQHA